MVPLDSLFPPPRVLRPGAGSFSAPEGRPLTVSLVGTRDEGPRERLLQRTGGEAAHTSGDVVLAVGAAEIPAGGYRLRISTEGVSLLAADDAGLWSGVATLRQLAGPAPWPACEIEDHPDFQVRGVMLDISRDRVPTTDYLLGLVDGLADLKINQLQLYTEHTFAYAGHEAAWSQASPMTPGEMRDLDDYCHARGIELVPNQQSFGHWHRWLSKPQYSHLANHPEGIEHAFSVDPEPFGLNPLDPRSFALLEDLYDQLLPCFRSRQINVGLDEPLDLGLGASRAACQERGKGPVYLEFLNAIHRRIHARDRKMLFWGDAILEYPDLVPELPQGAVALEWGYEAGHPFDQHTRQFRDSGLPFYVCPGTSTWQGLIGRTTNAERNLAEAAHAGLNQGARGYLITDWGDFGHWQPPDISLPGLLRGAGHGWRATMSLDRTSWAKAIDRHLPPLEADGATLLALGDLYMEAGSACKNGAPWFFAMRYAHRPFPPEIAPDMTAQGLERAAEAIQGASLGTGALGTAASLAAWGCQLGVAMDRGRGTGALAGKLMTLVESYRHNWLKTSRPGGLDASAGKLEALARRAEA